MRKRFAPGTLVHVSWVDAHTHDSWVNEGEENFERAMIPHSCESVGWVIRHTAKQLVIAASRGPASDGSMDYNNLITIPPGWTVAILGVAKE